MKLHCIVKPPKIKLGKLSNRRADSVELHHAPEDQYTTPNSSVFDSEAQLLHVTGDVAPHVDGPNGYAGESFVGIVIKGSLDHRFYTYKDVKRDGSAMKKDAGIALPTGTLFVVDADILHWVEYNGVDTCPRGSNLFILQWPVDTDYATIAFNELKEMYQ